MVIDVASGDKCGGMRYSLSRDVQMDGVRIANDV